MKVHVYVEVEHDTERGTWVFDNLPELYEHAVERLRNRYPEVALTSDPATNLDRLDAAWDADPDTSFLWFTTENVVLNDTSDPLERTPL